MQIISLLGIVVVGSLWKTVASLECYSCVSNVDVDCARKPGKQLEVHECEGMDECVTTIISGVTYRGCMSSVLPNKVCTNLCEKCSTSLCNVKIYPEDRLRCYQCLGSDCIDVMNRTTYSPMPCPIYKDSDRCYTNIISVNTVQRGCEATDLPTDNSCRNICLRCNYDGCNNELGLTHHYCRQCSHTQSSPDYECLRSQDELVDQCTITLEKNCYNRVLYGHRGKCFTYINEQTNVVNRGCSSAMGFYPTGNLTECYDENCNSNCLDIKCNRCDSISNPDCRNQTHVLKSENCSVGTTSCFSCEEGKHIWRGCGSELQQQTPNQVCYKCRDANGCNRHSVRSCYKCSSLDEENCAIWEDTSNITLANCSHSDEECVSTLVSRLNVVYTLRGCSSHVSECTESDPFCDRCEGSLCNTGPKTWEIEPRSKRFLTWLQYRKMQRSSSSKCKSRFGFQFYITFNFVLLWFLKKF